MKCPNCKNEVSPDWKRCPYCDYLPKLCNKPGCKSGWLPKEAHFCSVCGSPVKGEEKMRLKENITRAISGIAPTGSSCQSDNSRDSNRLTFTVGGASFKMIRVEGGSFLMGSPDNAPDAYGDEKPQHRVALSDYYIGETQVTQALWQAVMGNNPSYFDGEDHPVECVSWNDICGEDGEGTDPNSFLYKLNQETRKTFRLPKESEWEYAAKGGNKSRGYQYGGCNEKKDLEEYAWYGKNAYFYGNSSHIGYGTHVVKTRKPNELGLYDMSGNVMEWCQDLLSQYQTLRVLRGGGWDSSARDCRVANRSGGDPDYGGNNYGFRLALGF